jgi:hypothetical protein
VAEIDGEVGRLGGASPDAELRRVARVRLERIGRVKFHVAAWVLGMTVLTPLWALIEWQDNGGFERWSGNSKPGGWEPWILYVGGIWALGVAILALQAYLKRPTSERRSTASSSGFARAGSSIEPERERARRFAEWKDARMFLTRRDLAGTMVAALVVLIYAANVQDWWYLGSNRWAAVTMLAVGAIGCPVGARIVGEKVSASIVLLGLLGLAALVLAVLAVVTAAQWALLALAIVVVALWAGATLRHTVTPRPPVTAH